VRSPRARIEQLEGAVRAVIHPGAIPAPALGGLTEAEVELYADLCAQAREGTPEARADFAEVLSSPARLRGVLGILASLPGVTVKGLTLEELLAQAGAAGTGEAPEASAGGYRKPQDAPE